MNQTETGLNPMQMEAVEHTEGATARATTCILR